MDQAVSGETPHRRFDVGVLVASLMTVYAAVYSAWLVFGGASMADQDMVSSLAFIPMNALTMCLAWLAAWRRSDEPAVRRAMLFTGVSYAAMLLANYTQYVFFRGAYTDDSWVNIFYFPVYAGLLAALLSMPRARRTPLEFRKYAFDLATILLGCGLAVWHLVIVPTVLDGHGSIRGRLFDAAYPVGDIVVAIGLITAVLRRPLHVRRAVLFLAGITVYLTSDLVNQRFVEVFGLAGRHWTDHGFMLAYCLLAWGCQRFGRRDDVAAAAAATPTGPRHALDARTLVQPFSMLPYASLALCDVLLLIEAVTHTGAPWSTLASGTVVLTVLVVFRQITAVRENARLASEEAVRQNEARFQSLVQHSSDVISIVDRTTTLHFVSPAVTRVFGYTAEELEGTKLTALLREEDVARVQAAISGPALGSKDVSPPLELRLRHRDGRWLTVEVVATNLLHEPTVRGIVINARDVSERKVLEAQLTHQAFHDPLTGLANRALFSDRVSHALERGDRGAECLAVLFLDLDNFKTINDSLGHAAGDRLLVTVASRLKQCVRASDTVARLGGDEFALLIENAAGDMSATAAADRITAALREPFTIEGKEMFVSASIGIAIASAGTGTGAETAAALLRNADMAMYTAKAQGHGGYQAFEQHMHWEAVDRLELEADLRRAVERDELTLMYQPIVALDTGCIVGAEALVRWLHPRRGILYPAQFIPAAEEMGVITQIGDWVLREACRHAAAWTARLGADAPFAVTVNVSGHQLRDARLVETVRSALTNAGLRPNALVLEITESAFMRGTQATMERLTALKALGVRLAIDDFGTGYSSLSYLQRFPIDILKIAKPFVDDLTADADGSTRPALARAIIALAQTLGLRTIAEGIEARSQGAALVALGCELGQGYFYSMPLIFEQAHHLIVGRAGQPLPHAPPELAPAHAVNARAWPSDQRVA